MSVGESRGQEVSKGQQFQGPPRLGGGDEAQRRPQILCRPTCSRKVTASMLPSVLASPCRCPSSTSWHPWAQRFRLGCRGSKRGWARGSESWLCRQGLGEWGLQQEKGTPSIRYRPSTLLWIRLQREGQGR